MNLNDLNCHCASCPCQFLIRHYRFAWLCCIDDDSVQVTTATELVGSVHCAFLLAKPAQLGAWQRGKPQDDATLPLVGLCSYPKWKDCLECM